MRVSAWSNGAGTYGIRVGRSNRDDHFDTSWSQIEVEIDGENHVFELTVSGKSVLNFAMVVHR